MSVSLILVPVVLAMRIVMGKEKFENWINSTQIKIKSNFNNEDEIIKTIKMAGYDTEKWGGSIKTHISDESEFFFWEFTEGKWVAVFSKYQSRDIINNFIKDIENKSDKKIFCLTGNFENDSISENTYPTNFKDKELLVNTLKQCGVAYNVIGEQIVCTQDDCIFKFKQLQNGQYYVEITGNPNINYIYQILSDVDEYYKLNTQTKTYKELKYKIQQKGFKLENEEILEDNSILLTIRI